ncbi:LysR family transcriptional regulator [Lentilactobacillus curieae]|nr:LysR family transcriptional regulator [Lentilactobacillus curieae]
MKNYKTMLEYIDKILTYNNFTKAAQALYISQPYLTQVIKKQEDELGVQIINRHSKNYQLTKAGTIYYEYLKKLESEAQTFKNKLSYLTPVDKTYSFRIGVLSTLGSTILPAFIPNFLSDYKSVNLDIVENEPKISEENIRNGKIDYYIGQNPETLPPDLNYKIGASCGYYAVIPQSSPFFNPDYSILQSGAIPLNKLLKETLLVTSNGSAIREQLNHLFTKYSIRPNLVVESNNIFTISRLSQQGVGVAIVPQNIISKGQNYNLYPIDDDLMKVTFFIAYSENRLLSQVDNALIESFIKATTTIN